MQEFIVTLHRREDLESFYEDMETPGGNLFIPDRAVNVENRRDISRNTHYMLTPDEVALIKQDERVWDVEPAGLVKNIPQYKIDQGNFDKGSSANASHINWGILRHTLEDNLSNWGSGGTSSYTRDVTITASGKNVDVVIFDGHIDPAHPEFAVNPDGSGGSRVVQYNWFQNNIGSGTGTYVYTPYVDDAYADNNGDGVPDRTDDNNHGAHVAGTVAGNKYGWARDANIYNISIYSTNQNFGTNGLSSSTYWDYVRAWHNAKPINPVTGRRNPTITNHSYGSAITLEDKVSGSFTYSKPHRINYRGTEYDKGSGNSITTAEYNNRGIFTYDDTPTIPYYFTSRFADIQDAIDDGIIVVAAAGNDYFRIVNSTDQDYDNIVYYPYEYFGFDYDVSVYYNRGTGSVAGKGEVIVVGAQSYATNEDKASFSNTGSQVDIYAAGQRINSALNDGRYISSANDSRDSNYTVAKYQGTSMASPQVCGVLALLAESWPNMTQAEAQQWIIDNAAQDKMADTGTMDATDLNSLQGGPNKLLRWINQRPETGQNFPEKTFRPRPISGRCYPRPKIRKRG